VVEVVEYLFVPVASGSHQVTEVRHQFFRDVILPACIVSLRLFSGGVVPDCIEPPFESMSGPWEWVIPDPSRELKI